MIVAAAIRFEGKVYSVPAPARHDSVIALIARELNIEFVGSMGQGFVTDTGEFLNREQAADHARACSQLKQDVYVKRLSSEDLW